MRTLMRNTILATGLMAAGPTGCAPKRGKPPEVLCERNCGGKIFSFNEGDVVNLALDIGVFTIEIVNIDSKKMLANVDVIVTGFHEGVFHEWIVTFWDVELGRELDLRDASVIMRAGRGHAFTPILISANTPDCQRACEQREMVEEALRSLARFKKEEVRDMRIEIEGTGERKTVRIIEGQWKGRIFKFSESTQIKLKAERPQVPI